MDKWKNPWHKNVILHTSHSLYTWKMKIELLLSSNSIFQSGKMRISICEPAMVLWIGCFKNYCAIKFLFENGYTNKKLYESAESLTNLLSRQVSLMKIAQERGKKVAVIFWIRINRTVVGSTKSNQPPSHDKLTNDKKIGASLIRLCSNIRLKCHYVQVGILG